MGARTETELAKRESISSWALSKARAFVIGHKAIFEKAIIAFAAILPDYTRENCNEVNTKILFDIEDKFWRFYNLPTRTALFKAAWKIAKFENEHDPHYRDIIFGWAVEELVEAVIDGRWKPRPIGHPSGFWNEPRVEGAGDHGGYKGRRFARFIGRAGQYEKLEKLVELYQKELKTI